MCGVTKKIKIRKDNMRVSVKVAPVTKNIPEKRLKWYGHLKRRNEGHVLRIMLDGPVCLRGQTRGGRQKTRWKDSSKRYMESGGLKQEDAGTKWNIEMQNHSGDHRMIMGKPRGEEEVYNYEYNYALHSETSGSEVS